jgi:ribonuclease HII
VVGVDEVGRGCLAGPVVAGAVSFLSDHAIFDGVYDSKHVSLKNREILDKKIRASGASIGIGEVSAAIIDEIGIVSATKLAMRQACEKIEHDVILVDGPSTLDLNTMCAHVEAIIKGDQKVYSIAAASIVAKVYRDALITRLGLEYPLYAWQNNKGYGTRAHMEAIKKFGLTPLHRRSFIV